MAMRVSLLLALAAAVAPAVLQAAEQHEAALTAANPIRKVVSMLQAMQKKVSEEAEAEKELYDKFMCYCQTGGADLSKSISAAEAKAPAVSSDIQAAEGRLSQTQGDLKEAQADRGAAKASVAEATAIREKEAAAFAATKAEYSTNIAALEKAVASLEKGVGGGFLQTGAAGVLRKLAVGKQDMLEEDRQALLSFLSSTQGLRYVPQSGQIIGILKELGDEMAKSLAEATGTEQSAISAFEGLMGAKKKETAALSASIETKMGKVGELGVSIEQMKNDLTDTQEALLEDKKFLAGLEKSCTTKTAEWEKRVQTRADEQLALADTIKLLNDDDALNLFKKTLPSASTSFVQVGVSARAVRARALAALSEVRRAGSDRARLDFISLALRGKKIGFEKVIGMIDGMVATLKTEQVDDDHKKEYCAAQFDLSDDKKKGLERSVSDAESAIASAEEGIATVKEEIAALEAGIKALDKSVAEATEQRKEEHKAFTELMASDSAAKELLGFAKNRLNQFYNPKLYKPPAKVELSADDKIVSNFGGAVLAQVSAHTQQQRRRAAPPPPPETFGAYTKKSEETTGVVAMIDLLIKDLDKEMTEAETEEKDAQADYELLMGDSAEKRAQDSKSLTEKGATKADLEASLESHTGAKASASKELAATLEYIHSLHLECDWLLKYFDARKEARASEIDSLGKAKAVLSGSDFSLLQTRASDALRRLP